MNKILENILYLIVIGFVVASLFEIYFTLAVQKQTLGEMQRNQSIIIDQVNALRANK